MDDTNIKIFYLKKKVVFPHSTITVVLTQSPSSAEIRKGETLVAYPVRTLLDFVFHRGRTATASEVLTVEKRDMSVVLTLKGIRRVRLKKIISYKYAVFEEIESGDLALHEDLVEELRKKCQEVIFLINVNESDNLIKLMNFISSIDQLTDFIANYFILDFRHRYRIFSEPDHKKRVSMILKVLNGLIGKISQKRTAAAK